MENINYSLIEYFQNKYPKQKYPNDWGDGSWGEEEGEWEFMDATCVFSETGKLGHEAFNKLINDLLALFRPYNLKIYSEDDNPLGEKNKVSFSTEFKNHWCVVGRWRPGCGILEFTGFTNITPEIFLEDIKNILEKYSVKPTKAGEPTKGLNSVASVFMKYIEIKTPPHIIKLRKSHQDTIDQFRGRCEGNERELKQYNDLIELQDMKVLVEKNKSLMEENIKLVEKEDIRKKVQQWLENNSEKINFKIGKELYDII